MATKKKGTKGDELAAMIEAQARGEVVEQVPSETASPRPARAVDRRKSKTDFEIA